MTTSTTTVTSRQVGPSTARSPASRTEALRRMRSETIDVLVVGGVVHGAGAALDAASRGLTVGVLERRDWRRRPWRGGGAGETLTAMTSTRGDATRDDGEVVRVDLDGFPTTWPVQQGRWLRRFWVVFAVFWVVNFVLRLFGQIEVDVVLTVGAGLMAVAGVVNAVLFRTQRVQLEPEGYRLGDAVFRGRLRPWSAVDHVRPGRPRWGTHAEIRGRTASPAPVPLHGMSEEQAEELQRRVTAAQAEPATAAEERE